MNDLESRYRQALRWYPKAWRRRNEDAVLGTLLDRADDEKRQAPVRSELANLRGSALLTRLGPLGRIPGPVRDRAAALAFSMAGGIAIAALVAMALQKSTLPPQWAGLSPSIGPFWGVGFIYYVVWILALIAGLLGRRWVARGTGVASIAVAVALRLSPANRFFDHAPTTTTIIFIAALTGLSFVGNPFRSVRGRMWIAVGAASWAAFMGLTIWYQRVTQGGVAGRTDWFLGPLWQWLYWIVPFALILALVLMRLVRSRWGGAIITLLVAIIPFVVFGWSPQIDDLINRGTLLGIAVVIIGAVFFLPGLWRLRITITRV
jgi:hypothetical protein